LTDRAELHGVVLAAGVGSRLGYLGELLPKFLLPVAGKPLIWYALSALGSVGTTDVTIVVRRHGPLLKRYLEKADLGQLGIGEVRVRILRTPTRNPVETLLKDVPARPPDLAVTEGDSFTLASDLPSMGRRFHSFRPRVLSLVVQEPNREAIRRACEVIPGRNYRVTAIHEKPRRPRTRLRGCGIYLFRGDTFHGLVRETLARGRLECLPDLVATAAQDQTAMYFQTRGRNINVNTLSDLKAAWNVTNDLDESTL
jgi:NDP-sugar pyrophosphorylase family protein